MSLLLPRRSKLRPPSGGFVVPQFTNVRSWFRADAIPVQTDATALATWPDSGPLNLPASQATTSFRPTYRTNQQNGLPGVHFPSASRGLRTAAYSDAIAQPFTAFVVGGRQSSVATHLFFASLSDESYFRIGSTTNWQVFAGTLVPVAGADLNPHIFCVTFNGASSRLRVDGGAGTAVSPGTAGMTGMVLGCNGAAQAVALLGNIYEASVTAANLSLAEMNSWGSYLATKWGLTWNTAT